MSVPVNCNGTSNKRQEEQLKSSIEKKLELATKKEELTKYDQIIDINSTNFSNQLSNVIIANKKHKYFIEYRYLFESTILASFLTCLRIKTAI